MYSVSFYPPVFTLDADNKQPGNRCEYYAPYSGRCKHTKPCPDHPIGPTAPMYAATPNLCAVVYPVQERAPWAWPAQFTWTQDASGGPELAYMGFPLRDDFAEALLLGHFTRIADEAGIYVACDSLERLGYFLRGNCSQLADMHKPYPARLAALVAIVLALPVPVEGER